ncbi:hypothetical protein QUF70_09590 [Desulfobacterales bacterium HSG17]|nr:hypothetical protein [Desulfobacterales bacterium HSG17]
MSVTLTEPQTNRLPIVFRRYAGECVKIIEDGGMLKFTINGRVLSKTYSQK